MGAMNAAVAAVLRGELAAAGLNQKQLAERSGIPQVTIQRMLANRRAINVDNLGRIALALDTSSSRVLRAAQERMARTDQVNPDVEVILGKMRKRRASPPVDGVADEPDAG